MDIQWHGLPCLTFKGKNATVVTDPYEHTHAGIKAPKVEADVCLANADYDLHHNVAQIPTEARIFDWAGEYEAKDVTVQAIPAFDRPKEKDSDKKDDATPVLVFSFEIDGFKVCHLSNLGHKLTPDMIEAIGDVDILIVLVGGTNCLDAKKAHEVTEQVDPRIVIPMYYKVPGLKMPLADLEAFLKGVGLHSPTKEKVLKFQSPTALPQEQTEFKILEPVLG